MALDNRTAGRVWGSRTLRLSLYATGSFEMRWAELAHGTQRLWQPLEPLRVGWVTDLGPDWREALGHAVTDVLVDMVPGR